jgi:hypothetical protein
MLRIELTYPTPAEEAAAWRIARHHGLTTREDVTVIAAYGTAENSANLMRAVGQLVMTFECRGCDRKLDPSHRDALAIGLCPRCELEGGLENEHSDYGHPTPVADCPACDDRHGRR